MMPLKAPIQKSSLRLNIKNGDKAITNSKVKNILDSTPRYVKTIGAKKANAAKKPFIMRLLLKSSQITVFFKFCLRGKNLWKLLLKFYL